MRKILVALLCAVLLASHAESQTKEATPIPEQPMIVTGAGTESCGNMLANWQSPNVRSMTA